MVSEDSADNSGKKSAGWIADRNLLKTISFGIIITFGVIITITVGTYIFLPMDMEPNETITESPSAQTAAIKEKIETIVTLRILEGAATQGNPNYDPNSLIVKKGDKILVENLDMFPHTITNGAGFNDTNSAQIFDTGIIIGGESIVLDTSNIDLGTYPFYCTIHPYMNGSLIIE